MVSQIDFYTAKLQYEMDSADLFEALALQTDIVVIDTRQTQAFEREYIPSARNLPHRTMNAETTAHLDRSKIYVCYCDGIGCNASTKGALKLAQLGFHVRELIGGLAWWKSDGYATAGHFPQTGKPVQCAC
ncbi:MAG: hypothetical protein KDC44_02690 [Phaeodactylibacter sp.]|nr:hypothetical protein [Phaeodactylibacter sp.]